MRRIEVGEARVAEGPLTQEYGVTFRIPYGPASYDITLSDEDLNTCLQQGSATLLGRAASIIYKFEVNMPRPELPVLIGTRAVSLTRQSATWEAFVATSSAVHKHGGTLSTRRDSQYKWSLLSYVPAPPLQRLEDLYS